MYNWNKFYPVSVIEMVGVVVLGLILLVVLWEFTKY